MKIEVETMVRDDIQGQVSVHVCNFKYSENITVCHYPCYDKSKDNKNTYLFSLGRWQLKKLK